MCHKFVVHPKAQQWVVWSHISISRSEQRYLINICSIFITSLIIIISYSNSQQTPYSRCSHPHFYHKLSSFPPLLKGSPPSRSLHPWKGTLQQLIQLWFFYLPVSIFVEEFKGCFHVFFLENYWVLEAARNKFGIIYFSIFVSVDKSYQFTQFQQRPFLFLTFKSLLYFIHWQKTIMIKVQLSKKSR